ncbi:MAG: chondroitinase-B domain-containing protein [Cyclobacteriaceae bacterium]
MKIILSISFLVLTQLLPAQTRYDVSSQTEFNTAHSAAITGDSIVWASGVYEDVFMDIPKNGLIVTAAVPGTAIFKGESKVEIDGDNVTLSGLQYIGGNIGTSHVIRIWGSDVLITQINIADYTCYKYLIVDEDSRRTTISYSNFENRLNLDDQNILSILVHDSEPGYHKIQYCSFKNFEGTGNDLGIEPIRIGVSTQAEFDSRTIVEYCYFTHCDGDGELISNKAAQNVIRYNTFEDNPKAELVLRHGDEAIVYGNFFLNNMGGVRVREGSNHFIYNNYFEGLERRSIYLQNEQSDPLSDIHIYYNTIVNSAEVILGGNGGSYPPANVTFANNIFADPVDQLFEDPTGSETWLGNISRGALGMSAPGGIEATDPGLTINTEGFAQITDSSPAINSAVTGYPAIPGFEGLAYDSLVSLDLMGQERPESIDLKDIGSVEYSASLLVKPHVTAENTGPFYLRDENTTEVKIAETVGGEIILDPAYDKYVIGSVITATAVPASGFDFGSWSGDVQRDENPIQFTVSEGIEIDAEFVPEPLSVLSDKSMSVYPNPTDDSLVVEWPDFQYTNASVEIISLNGKKVMEMEKLLKSPTDFSFRIDVAGLKPGTYLLKTIFYSKKGRSSYSSQVKFIKNQ